jgi:arsenate reductase
MSYTIYHNPRCSKSRQALALLNEHGVEPEIVLYLQDPLTAQGIKDLLAKLGLSARELLRSKERLAGDLGLPDASLDDDQLIELMAEHPVLIERPIVSHADQAVLGRPPENVLKLVTI